jgi:nitroreductase
MVVKTATNQCLTYVNDFCILKATGLLTSPGTFLITPSCSFMDLFDAIAHRRSIRRYRPDSINESLVSSIVRAGCAAPSAGNEQPWHFLVIRARTTLIELSISHPYADMLREAPLAILVCADMNRVKHKDYWPQDCAAAVQNMLLATHGLGLGSVWVGVYPREARVAEVRRVITLPDTIIPFALLPIGLPAEEKGPDDRFDPKRIHLEHW